MHNASLKRHLHEWIYMLYKRLLCASIHYQHQLLCFDYPADISMITENINTCRCLICVCKHQDQPCSQPYVCVCVYVYGFNITKSKKSPRKQCTQPCIHDLNDTPRSGSQLECLCYGFPDSTERRKQINTCRKWAATAASRDSICWYACDFCVHIHEHVESIPNIY